MLTMVKLASLSSAIVGCEPGLVPCHSQQVEEARKPVVSLLHDIAVKIVRDRHERFRGTAPDSGRIVGEQTLCLMEEGYLLTRIGGTLHLADQLVQFGAIVVGEAGG